VSQQQKVTMLLFRRLSAQITHLSDNRPKFNRDSWTCGFKGTSHTIALKLGSYQSELTESRANHNHENDPDTKTNRSCAFFESVKRSETCTAVLISGIEKVHSIHTKTQFSNLSPYFISLFIFSQLQLRTISKSTSKSLFEPCGAIRVTELVPFHATTNSHIIAGHLPGRNARQRRDRWSHYVNPNVSKYEWTESEVGILFPPSGDLGRKGFVIADVLPGRSRNSVKNGYCALQCTARLNIKNQSELAFTANMSTSPN
jgi:hypothetical protein